MEKTDLEFDVEAAAPLLSDNEDEDSTPFEDDEEFSNGGLQDRNEDSDHDDVTVESLDYDSIHNDVHDQLLTKEHRRRLYGYTGRTLAKWWITILIGLVVGVIAFLVESCQEVIITSKREWTDRLLLERGIIGFIFLNYAVTSVALVLLSSCLVVFWAPAAAGGGVTLVMAYLNGNDIPDFFRPRTLLTKILGTICTVSSGLPIGQEGPMVHIGGAIASELTWMHGPTLTNKLVQPPQPTWRENILKKLRPKESTFEFYSDKDRREFISAGAAAGYCLAAAFGAPIGGVLFSMEEASSYWSRKVMWRSLLCTTCATMVLSLLNQRQFSFLLPGIISFEGLKPEFDFIDLPLFVVTSIFAGVIGAFLNIFHDWLARIRPSSKHKGYRVLEACLFTFISVIAIFLLPHYFGQCLPIQEGQEVEGYWFRYTCPLPDLVTGVQFYNDLASLYFAVPSQTIQKLLASGAGAGDSPFTIPSLAIHSASFLSLFTLAYGIATPGGIFMPSIMVGASFGACLGRVFELLFPRWTIRPGMHALVGATAMLGGVFRSSISLVVIMVEGTGEIEFLLPAILAIVLSNWVAHHIHSAGAYESDLERIGGVHFLQSEPSQRLHLITARDIMAPDVTCFNETTSVAEVVGVLRETCHNGFPITRHSSGHGDHPDAQIVGVMVRHQILLLLEQRAFLEVDAHMLHRHGGDNSSPFPRLTKEHKLLHRQMHVYHHSHNPHRRYLSSRPEAIDELGIDELLFKDLLQPTLEGSSSSPSLGEGNRKVQDIIQASQCSGKEIAIDFRPWMNRAPLTVCADTSARRVYVIFRTLGLRHLCVTDASNRLVGMITRKDVAMTHKDRLEYLVDSDSQTDGDNSQSSFGGKLSRFDERTARDVLFSLP